MLLMHRPFGTGSWALTGAFVSALAPVCAVARLASARRRPRVPAIDVAGVDVFH